MRNAPRVFVACDLPEMVQALFIDRFEARCNATRRILSREELLQGVQAAEVLVLTATDKLDAELIRQLPSSLRVVCTYSIGMEHMDVEALKARGIAVLATPDVLSESCADTALLLMLGAARRVVESSAPVRGGAWRGWAPRQLLGAGVGGRRLRLWGGGRRGP